MTSTRLRITTAWIAGATAIALNLALTVSPAVCAEESEAGEKILLMGIVAKVEEGSLLIRKAKAGKEEQRIGLTADTRFGFVGFQGMGKPADKPTAGFAVKANLAPDNTAKFLLFSPDFPPLQEIPNKHKLTAAELFQKTDQNQDGKVDYLEYASKIFQSYKHLPDRYQSKFDTNGDDTLDLQEFTTSLDRLDWWRLSRKSAEEWVHWADKDKSGQLENEEAKTFIHAGHGDVNKLLAKLDRDKSGGISVSELETYLEANILGKKSKRTSDLQASP